MKFGYSIALAAGLSLASAPVWAQAGADFRTIVAGAPLTLVLDAHSIQQDGNGRVFDMYTDGYADDGARAIMRTHVRIDCKDHTQSILTVAVLQGDGSDFGQPQPINSAMAKGDEDETGARIINLVCADPAARDRYAAAMPQTSWRAALKAAAYPPVDPAKVTISSFDRVTEAYGKDQKAAAALYDGKRLAFSGRIMRMGDDPKGTYFGVLDEYGAKFDTAFDVVDQPDLRPKFEGGKIVPFQFSQTIVFECLNEAFLPGALPPSLKLTHCRLIR